MNNHDVDTQPLKQTQVAFPTLASFEKEGNILLTKDKDNKGTDMEPTKEPHKPSNLFDNKEKYLAFKKQWSKLANEKKLTSMMMVFYNVVRGIEYFNGFTRITNPIKLENGMKPNGALTRALSDLDYIYFPEKNKFAEAARAEFIKMFEGTIDDEFMTKVANYI